VAGLTHHVREFGQRADRAALFAGTRRMTGPRRGIVRVGIEDNLWRRKGEKFTSVQQVEQVVRMARELGRDVATADDARRIMKIGTWYDSVDETLAELGMSPNRKPGQRGFLVQ
jgi:hypothetical protein